MLGLALIFAGAPAVTAEARVYTWKEARNAGIPKASSMTKAQKKKYEKIAEDEFEYEIKSHQRTLASASAGTAQQRVTAQGNVWQNIKDEFDRYDMCNPVQQVTEAELVLPEPGVPGLHVLGVGVGETAS